ncbi:hypothetical protein PALB_6570 [Pseudoalteromonas luteoviolacea B = ATCC 29581]|nr:hypothetical protein PALB_6570 [Pseudoalteromonas luteoviolacea B = ATCC 29581]
MWIFSLVQQNGQFARFLLYCDFAYSAYKKSALKFFTWATSKQGQKSLF